MRFKTLGYTRLPAGSTEQTKLRTAPQVFLLWGNSLGPQEMHCGFSMCLYTTSDAIPKNILEM